MNDLKVPFLSEERIIATKEFIANNNLSLRPSTEIKEKYESLKDEDFFGFSGEALIPLMEWKDARDFYQEGFRAKIDSGDESRIVPDIKEVAQDFLDYMNFAWGKAQDERGISASRSITKLGEWLWCMNRQDLCDEINRDDLYNPYGSPALISVCEKMGIAVPESLREFAKAKY